MLNNKFLVIFPILSILLTACVGSTIKPVTIYTIAPQWDSNKQTSTAANHTSNIVLKISPIRSTEAFSSRNIIYTDKLHSRNYYIYSQWSDAPVRLLQTLFQVTLEKSGQFKAVLAPASAARANQLLECTLYDFSHHINNNKISTGVVRAACALIDYKSRKVLASKDFVAIIPTVTENAQGAAVALNKAANSLSAQLLDWLSSKNHTR